MKSLVIAAILVSGLIFSSPGEQVWSQGKDMTSSNDLAYVAELSCGFDDAIEQVTTALKAEQFGIISRIDLHTTFKEKLGVDMKPHSILGACNPKLAHQAVTACPEASLMLPCNVTVQYVDDQKTIVRIGNPHTFMAVSGLDQDKVIRSVGDQANERLQRVAQSLTVGK